VLYRTKQPTLAAVRANSAARSQVTQYKKGADSLLAQGKRRYDRKMQGFGGQKKPIFHKKAKVPPPPPPLPPLPLTNRLSSQCCCSVVDPQYSSGWAGAPLRLGPVLPA
jgi:hypothetical protein